MSNDSDTYNIFSKSDDLIINRKFEFEDKLFKLEFSQHN